MKVLEISSRADIGGGPKHLLDLLTYSPKNIKLYSAIPYGFDLSEKIKNASLDTIEIPHRKLSFKTLLKLILFCKKNDIQIIHSHGRGAGYYSRLMKVFGFKVIHTLHGVHVEDGIINRVKLYLDRLLVPFTDIFICVSNGEMQKALSYKVIKKSKTKVIFNGVLPQKVMHLKSNTPKIAMLGRLSYPKGYDLLISSIEKFCEKYPQMGFQINIAGNGEEKEILLDQLSKTKYAQVKINFQGQTDSPIEFLKKHTHFLSFSRFEGMPISVLEAMSVGLPCMVSDVVGNNDIINSENGNLFDQDFCTNFESFITQNQSKKVANAYKDIENKYNIQMTINKIMATYQE